MSTPKIQNAYRDATTDTDDIADLLFVTTTGLSTNGDACVSVLCFHDGANDVLVTSSAPLPVTISGVATATKQDTGNASLASIDGKITAVDTGAVILAAGTAAFGKLAANDGVDIGDVTINNASIAVTGTFWQATQPVSLASVPSHAVTNAGTFAVQAAQSGTWTVELGATDNAVLDAIAASVAGTLTVGTHAVTQSGTWNVGTVSTITNVVHVDDNSGSLTVDAPVSTPVFVRLSDGSSAISTLPVSLASVPSHAVTNAGTFAVQAAQSGTWNVTNISGTVSLPTGAATEAKQPALGTAGTASSNVITVQGITSMTPIQVGDNGGTLSIDDGAGSITVDGTVAATQSGNWSARLQDGSGNAITSAARGSERALTVQIVDASGSQITSFGGGGGGGGTSEADDADFTAGTTVGTPAMGVYESAPSSVTDGDLGIVGITVDRRLKTSTIITGSLPDTGDSDLHVTAVVLGNISDAILPAYKVVDAAVGSVGVLTAGRASAAAPTNVSADDDTVFAWHLRSGAYVVQPSFAGVLASTGNGADGTGVQRVTIANNSTGILAGVTTVSTVTNLSQLGGTAISMGTGTRDSGTQRVTIATNDVVPASQSGTWNIGTVTTVTTCSTVTTLTGGGIAHDSADSGNPHKIGAKAETSPKGITLVADGDRTDLYADADGMLMVKLNTSGADIISDATSNTDGSSTASSVFTAVAGVKNYITAFQVFRTDAGTTPIYIDFRDGTGGSVLWRAVLPPNGGSNSPSCAGPALFKTSANMALAYDVSAATSTVYINVSGYQSKV